MNPQTVIELSSTLSTFAVIAFFTTSPSNQKPPPPPLLLNVLTSNLALPLDQDSSQRRSTYHTLNSSLSSIIWTLTSNNSNQDPRPDPATSEYGWDLWTILRTPNTNLIPVQLTLPTPPLDNNVSWPPSLIELPNYAEADSLDLCYSNPTDPLIPMQRTSWGTGTPGR
ncbi:hypothetical protein F5146DRAFT_1130223 [Armillaria mellea]|nr:hypothetical protein F5146DRAFT_1130223 [Armillaria mellea]